MFRESGDSVGGGTGGFLERPGWDDYFLGIAQAVSRRGDCSRRRVGAVVVRADRRIASTGYNGVPPNEPGCLQRPCERVGKSLRAERGEDEAGVRGDSPCPGYSDCRSIHAESNALLYASRDDCVGGTLYCTDAPCHGCLKLIKGAGIARLVTPTAELDLLEES
ncbi:deoxycytidylate deaminase [Nonomuraea sp. ZG12]|uniref:deoxycytidylate deaminase n=1 Tax=Nonomuraea sp. ZG12 TaxID=3452207 RepID=UPI003F8A77DD